MNNKYRILSILESKQLSKASTGLPTFEISSLDISSQLDFDLPLNLRLGHVVEKVVAESIRRSNNYEIIYENTQIIEEKKTIGEIDFIIKELESSQLIHMELAYKFYLYDPNISENPINNWVGPNRNDSLFAKLRKLKNKQFPLLELPISEKFFPSIQLKDVRQELCLLVSLYLPFKFKEELDLEFKEAVKGYYLKYDEFLKSLNKDESYYMPRRKEWGIDPSTNDCWSKYEVIEDQILLSITEKQAPLIWKKAQNKFTSFFVVWWD